MRLLSELRRRNVFRVGAAYVVTAWLILQVVDTLGQILELPASIPQLILAALIVGFPVAVVLAWIYELGPGGLRKDSGAPGPSS